MWEGMEIVMQMSLDRKSMGTEHVSHDYKSWDCRNAGD